MKNILLGFFSVAILVTFCGVSFGEDFVEPGRFGAEGMIGTDGSGAQFQAGLIREADEYEAALDLDGFTSTSGRVASHDIGISARVGKRFNIGSFNYMSMGVDASTSLISVTAGNNTNGVYTVGPYFGFQRHFSGTNLMLSIYALPVSYTYTPGSSTTTGASSQSWQFFQQGAFGLSYLF